MSKLLCIYHGNCADGFGAAWAVRHALGDDNVEFVPGIYGNDPPDVTNRDVLLVDFSYKRPALESMASKAVKILVLDHHKTAQEDLAPFINHNLVGLDSWHPVHRGSIQALFDMERSGAGIAWDFFHPHDLRPDLIDHLEDRDLWRFKLPQTREIQAAVFSYPYDFAVWDELMQREVEELAAEGVAIERKHHKDIAELVGVCKRRMRIGGVEVWAASLPYTLTSDAGHMMAQGEPFAACYWDTPKGRVFSLRSTEDSADVSLVAKDYGGGGHKHASGFQVPFSRLAEFECTP